MLVTIPFWDAVLNSLISVLKCQKEFGFNPLGNRKPVKGFKNVSDMKTSYFRDKMALVVCDSWEKKKKSLETIVGIRNYESTRNVGEWE